MTTENHIIYELRFFAGEQWNSFYVGRTTRPKERFYEHCRNAKTANDDSYLVYRFIKNELMPLGIEFEMNELERFNPEDYIDQEDEHIVSLLLDGAKLKNMKKGDANWLANRQQAADDMRQRGMTSYRKYRETLSYEEQQRRVDDANAKRITDELAANEIKNQYLTTMQLARELRRQQQRDYMHTLSQEHIQAKEEKRIATEQRKIKNKLNEEAYAEEREQHIRAETQRLVDEEILRQNHLSIKSIADPGYLDDTDLATYKSYATLMSQYITTIEQTKPNSDVLPDAYTRLKFLANKIKTLDKHD